MGASVRFLALVFLSAGTVVGCGNSSSGADEAPWDAGPDPIVRTAGSSCGVPNEIYCALDVDQAPTGDVLTCTGGVLATSFSCPSGQTCATLEGHGGVKCGGVTLVGVGGACASEGAAACSPDLTSVGVCTDGAWVVGHRCGSAICEFVTGSDGVARAQCGPSDVYSVGDDCDFPACHGACSVDGSSVLSCGSSRKTQVLYACASSQTCKTVDVDGGLGVECYPPMTVASNGVADAGSCSP